MVNVECRLTNVELRNSIYFYLFKKSGATRGASACAARATSTIRHSSFVIRHLSFNVVSYEKGGPMDKSTIKIRLMKEGDFDAVVRIDEKVLKASRPEYYEMKFEKLFKSKDYLPTSLVAEEEDGAVVGFVMGVLYMGEYGIFQEEATLDTIGVDPQHQHKGIGKLLINEFMDHLKTLGVQKINTLVDWNDSKLIQFFSANQFSPSKSINLDRSL